MADRPNIVLMFVDNQPADMMGCSGNTEIHTPHLDRLAGRSQRFVNAYCPNAMCSPCRASVLTGLMPSQHGIHTWLDDGQIETWPQDWNAVAEFDTLPDLLGGAGYDTALIGKYHLGIADKPQNGFKTWITLQRGHIMSFYGNDMIVNDDTLQSPEHAVDFFTGHAETYLGKRSARKDEPFFLFLTYPAPYGLWPPLKDPTPNPFTELYEDTLFDSAPREAISRELIDWMLIRNEKMPDDEPEYYRTLAQMPNDLPTLRNYYSQMSVVDAGVGRVLAALEHNGFSDNTLFIYTADHGMSLGRHGFWGHSEDTWPSNTHRQAHNIPLIITPPADEGRGSTIEDSMVGTTDIFATVLDWAGIPAPVAPPGAGQSLRHLQEASERGRHDAVFMEQEETRAIRTRKWLYMQRYAPTPYDFANELYDLENDPDERRNLAGDPAHAGTVRDLSGRLAAFFETHADPRWDLWRGGTVKSNSTRPFLWQEVWGKDWEPGF